MGQVFRARDSVLHRHVALKFMQPLAELSGLALTSRLKVEARAIARLDHENIIRVFDVSEWRRGPSSVVPFLVMECLEGKPLSTRLHEGALEWDEAVATFRDVLAGLAHAHAQQVIHRDLKPSNVFILPGARQAARLRPRARPPSSGSTTRARLPTWPRSSGWMHRTTREPTREPPGSCSTCC
ncbi:protein kinase [Myxococcus sp. CA033]|nr:protein kinase [Myxococcus sp. CA033]